uniref:POX domain-containing protein n=1 Tax=Fagus sylvatica TaxID=28930 RepID=A0A2N9FVQ2_FAGSY
MAREHCEDKSRNMVSSAGFCYPDVSSSNPNIQTQHLMNQIPGFESNQEIFNLTNGMEMIGFSKNLQQQSDSNSVMWKEFFGKSQSHAAGPSSSKTINESTSDFYQHEYSKSDFTAGISETSSENLMVGAHHDNTAWPQEDRLLVDDSSLRCVFPCEGNERPSQGLSLSLCSANPSSIGLQSFELRQTNHHNQDEQDDMRFIASSSRDGFYGKSPNNIQQQQMMQDIFLGKAANHHEGQFQLRSSKYLAPAQELLNEFCCSLGTKQTDQPKQKSHKAKQWEEDNNGSSSSRKQALYSLEYMELQKRKTKLLSMLEEVDRRYRHYCNQMKAVVSSFEAVAGHGAATVYSALASKAMSRHFRCLKDGIVNQIMATKKAMGEKDPVAPGTTKGETPRLRILDQTLRQQRAFQQMSMMETHPWRPQRGLPERSVSVLRAWLFEHFLHPYPSDVDKHILARQTGLSRSQASPHPSSTYGRRNVLGRAKRAREQRKNNNMSSSDGVTINLDENGHQNQNPPPTRPHGDQKPTQDQLVRIDSECLSSIITTNPDKNDSKTSKTLQNHHMQQQQHSFGRVADETYGAMELDFSSYNHHHSSSAGGAVSYPSDHSNANQNNFNGGGGVSLTLGLQQHGGSGVSLAFSPASQNSLFYARDHIEDCQPVQYSLLDGEGQNLPYRNLMGAQLLHDLAG